MQDRSAPAERHGPACGRAESTVRIERDAFNRGVRAAHPQHVSHDAIAPASIRAQSIGNGRATCVSAAPVWKFRLSALVGGAIRSSGRLIVVKLSKFFILGIAAIAAFGVKACGVVTLKTASSVAATKISVPKAGLARAAWVN